MSFKPASPIGPQDRERLDRPIDEAYGLPGRTYTDSAYFRLEQEKIFRRSWVCAGHITDIPDRGDITAVSVGGAPIMLVHGPDGEPRAFHNICRHKGNVLVEGSRKKQRTIVCGYHCWTYRLDGSLSATPNFGGTGKDWEGTTRRKENLGLRPVRLHNWHGWLFVTLDEEAGDFEEHAEPLIACLASYDFSDLKLAAEMNFVFEANWKLTLENFFDCYHIPYIHGDSLAKRNEALYVSGETVMDSVRRASVEGPLFPIIYDYPAESEEAHFGMPIPDAMPREWRTRIVYLHFFPNLLLFVQPDHIVSIIETPVAPDRAYQKLKIFFHGDAAFDDNLAARRKHCVEFWSTINAEDIDVCRTLQAGRESPAFDGGIFAPAWESQVHAFQQRVADYMAR